MSSCDGMESLISLLREMIKEGADSSLKEKVMEGIMELAKMISDCVKEKNERIERMNQGNNRFWGESYSLWCSCHCNGECYDKNGKRQ